MYWESKIVNFCEILRIFWFYKAFFYFEQLMLQKIAATFIQLVEQFYIYSFAQTLTVV